MREIALLLSMIVAVPAIAQNSNCGADRVVNQLAQSYKSCNFFMARRLERSKESADNVGVLAIGACDKQRQAYSGSASRRMGAATDGNDCSP